MLKLKKQNKTVIIVIKRSTFKKFLILDLVVGSGIYYAIKVIYSSVLIATVGSVIGTEGIRRYQSVKKY